MHARAWLLIDARCHTRSIMITLIQLSIQERRKVEGGWVREGEDTNNLAPTW